MPLLVLVLVRKVKGAIIIITSIHHLYLTLPTHYNCLPKYIEISKLVLSHATSNQNTGWTNL